MPRMPAVTDCLRLVRSVDSRLCSAVLDVGAQRRTDFLMEVFPDKRHHLFEPVSHYHADLRRNYEQRSIDFVLHGVALSDVDGQVYLHNSSGDASGRITHSYIATERDESVAHLVNIESVASRRLDSMKGALGLEKHRYLIKLDVDGAEEKIIAGGLSTVSEASFVVIEASLGRRNLMSRCQMIEGLGFRLFDICDPAYYFGQLSQVDLVFINEQVRRSEIKFRPWEYAGGKVIWKKWQHGSSSAEPFEDPFA